MKAFAGKSHVDGHTELQDRESLSRTREKYSELKDFLTNVSDKLSTLYNFNEKEFLGTYRVHTLDLQSEIKYLKDKVRVAEEILNDDNTVSSLEREANWFRDEADRLRSQSETMRRDLAALLDRVDVLDEQRLSLTDELKQILREIRLYEVNLLQFEWFECLI
jgi:chromosome segregation ATPase